MGKVFEIKWRKQPRQLTFLRACGLSHPFDGGGPRPPIADVIGYGGAAGGGKSDALLMAGIIACLSFPGCNVGYFRREYPQLEGPGGAIMRSHQLLTGLARWNGTSRRWTFPNGSVLQFCHVKDEKDVYNYQSQQFDLILLDEATQFTRFQYRYLRTRNRATVPGVKPFTALATNPGNVGHMWFKEEFVTIGPPEVPHRVKVEDGEEVHIFIPARLDDNQALLERDPDYRKRLEAQPEVIRRQLLEGDWDIADGIAFPEFRRDLHVIEPFEIPDDWIRFRALDWGYSRPYCVGWYAIDYDGRLYKYRELYGWGGQPDVGTKEDPEEVARKILELEQGEKIRYGVADDAIFGAKQDNSPSIAEQFARAGVIWTPVGKGPRSRIQGKLELHHRLKPREGELPMLVFFNTCVHTIRTLPSLVLDPRNPEDVDTNQEDHCLVGDTLVNTEHGPVPIRELVGTTGRVWSHDGKLHRYYDVRLTQKNVPVFTVEFEDGRKVTATPNHRFLLSDGTWKELRELKPGDDVVDIGPIPG